MSVRADANMFHLNDNFDALRQEIVQLKAQLAAAAATSSSAAAHAGATPVNMISIVGKSTRVVEAPGLTIDELAGNVASNEDTISIALVNADAGTAEPWLTLDYDEWICVLEGLMVFSREGCPDVQVNAGQTVKINRGTRFRPSFPTTKTKYIPVCLPAFTPERCLREDEPNDTGVAQKLAELHKTSTSTGTKSEDTIEKAEVLYHMTTRTEWEAAQEYGCYYPKTFVEDGHYTHATAVPSRLVETANHFYQDVPGEWICLEFHRSALRRCGIFVRDEMALPVGDQKVSDDWLARAWVCPHVIGGIPVAVVDAKKIRVINRNGKKFVGIEGM